MAVTREINYFPNSSNAIFSNITITHACGNTGSSERNGLTRLLDNISKGAFHDAAERGDPPRCRPHTRVAIRAEIMQWISAPDARRKFIIWMYGPAGSGKTAIAQSIADAYKSAASFFFSRAAAGRNDTTPVVATIAYQISRFLPQFADALFTAIERDPSIFSRALATQMQVLVVEPLKALPPLPQPIFVILDGLDKAGPTPQAQVNLLNAIGTATKELRHIPLIFLIASRPESEIRKAFNGHLSPLTRSLVLDENYKPDEDIRRYLTSAAYSMCRGTRGCNQWVPNMHIMGCCAFRPQRVTASRRPNLTKLGHSTLDSFSHFTSVPPSQKRTTQNVILPASKSPSEERFTAGVRGTQTPRESDENEKKKRTFFWGGRDKDYGKKKEQERSERETHHKVVQHKHGENDGFSELSCMIGYLLARASNDWALILDVCDRASASVNDARDAVKAVQLEFKYGKPPTQLNAVRLWAIMLRNSSPTFISQSTTNSFLDTIEDLLGSSKTSPVVRERLLEVVAAAAYASINDPGYECDGFKGLWKRVKPENKPDEGEPFYTNDIFGLE